MSHSYDEDGARPDTPVTFVCATPQGVAAHYVIEGSELIAEVAKRLQLGVCSGSDDGSVTIGASAVLALKILCCRPAALVSSNGSLAGHAIDIPMTYVSPDGVAELNGVLDDPPWGPIVPSSDRPSGNLSPSNVPVS